ncbi:putative Na+/H+ antiporter, partial [Acinetobacter baumannii]
LFVNISIGGTLTPFAAPPVLMVAAKWNWDIWFMVSNFGWKAAVAVVINAGLAMLIFRNQLGHMGRKITPTETPVPWT